MQFVYDDMSLKTASHKMLKISINLDTTWITMEIWLLDGKISEGFGKQFFIISRHIAP